MLNSPKLTTSEYIEVNPQVGAIPEVVAPAILETTILGAVIFYTVNFIVRPLLVDDRQRWFAVIEKLTDSIDKLADKFDQLERRIARLEDRLK